MKRRDKKFKIAMIGHKRIPLREGGVKIVVEEISKRLVKQVHVVHAYNRKGKHVSGKEYENEGLKLIQTFTIDLALSFFATIRALFARYDVIHFHAKGFCSMLWIPHIFGIRTVVTIHGRVDIIELLGKYAYKYRFFALQQI